VSPVRRLFEGGAYSKAALIRRRRLFNLLTATVTGTRKREAGLVVPAKFTAVHARTEEREDFEESGLEPQCIFIILWKYSNKHEHHTAAAALIRGRRLLTFRPHTRRPLN